MTAINAPGSTPWYRHFWAWFVIIPPLTAVIAGTSTVMIANKHADNLVTGDFSKVGLGYQSTSAARSAAVERGIGAHAVLPPADGTLRIALRGAHGDPAQLTVILAHATQGERDQRLTLVRVDGGRYEGRLPRPLTDRHYLIITDPDERWRLEGRVTPGMTEARLGAGANAP